MFVGWVRAGISGRVVLGKDVVFICWEDGLFTMEEFVCSEADVEFPSSVASGDKGNDGEGRNNTVSFSGGVAIT